jgi:hypothetical protein
MDETTAEDRLIVLGERLAEATIAGDAEWRSEEEDWYVWEHLEGSVAIGARDRDGQPPYELAVMNRGGQRVEQLLSALVADDEPAPWNEPLAELYRLARRSALHADEIIDALIDALQGGPMTADRADSAYAETTTASDYEVTSRSE